MTNRFQEIAGELNGEPAPLPHLGVDLARPALVALQKAGHDFTSELKELAYADGSSWPNSDEFRECTNQETGYSFGRVSKDYGLPQHRDIAEMIDMIIGSEEGVKVKCAGSAYGGSVWWRVDLGTMKTDQVALTKEFKEAQQTVRDIHGGEAWVPKGAEMDIRAELFVRHTLGGNGPLEFALLLTGLVCKNMWRMTLGGGVKTKMRHSSKLPERVKFFGEAIEAARTKVGSLSDVITKMASRIVHASEFDAFIVEMLGKAPQKKREIAFRSAYYNAPGAAPHTAYGLMQVASYHTNHLLTPQLTGGSAKRFRLDMPDDLKAQQARAESVLYGGGHRFNQKALQYVMNMVN